MANADPLLTGVSGFEHPVSRKRQHSLNVEDDLPQKRRNPPCANPSYTEGETPNAQIVNPNTQPNREHMDVEMTSLNQDFSSSTISIGQGNVASNNTCTVVNNFSMHESISSEQALLKLEPAKMDRSAHKGCLPGTRKDFIKRLLDWIQDLSFDSGICWVHGSAGLGKSTIANSIADECFAQCVAYIFFNRNDPTSSHPHLVIRTLAYQIAMRHVTLRDAIVNAIQQNPMIATEPLNTQFVKLLFEPVISCLAQLDSPLLVVIDALDECGDARLRRALVDLIAKRFTELPLKFLITSRAELDIAGPFGHNVKINSVELLASDSVQDVFLFLKESMARVGPSCWLPAEWPGPSIIDRLSKPAGGVFIWGSAVAVIENDFNPSAALHLLLESMSGNDNSLDHLYNTTLSTIGQWENARYVKEFQSIIGLVIAGQVPMTVRAIDELLALKFSSSSILKSLRSLLQYSDDQPIRTLHATISDYLTDSHRCGKKPWFIDISVQHQLLTCHCLLLMRERLCFNICDLETSHLLNEAVHDLGQRVESHISLAVAYACQHFARHLQLSYVQPSEFDGLSGLEYFMRSQLLFWVEALSFLGETKLVASIMTAVKQWYHDTNVELADLAAEAVKLMAVFGGAISESTPHLYISAMPLWRRNSCLWQIYVHSLQKLIDVETGGIEQLPSLQGTLQGHRDCITSVAFSLDGTRIVSGSYDNTVRIWDAQTGAIVAGPFEGHTSWVSSVAFSPDGTRIVSGSDDNTVRIWDVQTGTVVAGPFEGHTNWVSSVAFSPDGTRIVSGSDDKTVQIWDAQTGTIVAGPFEGHTNAVSLVAFSPDGTRTNMLSQRLNQSISTARITSKGWLCTPTGDLLFWIPPHYRTAGLCWPPDTVVIGGQLIRFNLDTFVHGTAWRDCFIV